MAEIRVPGAARLQHGESLVFRFAGEDGETEEGFVLRYCDGPIDRLVAYRNHCPHIGTDLDMGRRRFFSRKVSRIYCNTHGARFLPLTGECDFGPCVGLRLDAYEVRQDGDDALVTIP